MAVQVTRQEFTQFASTKFHKNTFSCLSEYKRSDRMIRRNAAGSTLVLWVRRNSAGTKQLVKDRSFFSFWPVKIKTNTAELEDKTRSVCDVAKLGYLSCSSVNT